LPVVKAVTCPVYEQYKVVKQRIGRNKHEEFITAYSSTFKKPSKIMELPREIEVFKSVRFKSEAINILGKERFNHVLKQLYATPSEGGFGMSTFMIARLLKKPVSTVKLWLRELVDEKVLRLRPVIHPPKIGNLVLDLGMKCEGYEFKNGYTYVTNIYPTNELCYTIWLAYGDGTIDKTGRLVRTTQRLYRLRIIIKDFDKFVEKIDGKIQHPEKEERIKQHLQTF